MIRCKTCKKIAKLDRIFINGLDEVLLIGSCKCCGYKKEPKIPDNDFNGKMFKKYESKIDYDDFEELGIDR